jgi:hypothetical protein
MICHQVQTNLSLYLYGELEFAVEEAVEEHLGTCAFCQSALAREKAWHSALNNAPEDASFEFLSECRNGLKRALPTSNAGWKGSWLERWRNWMESAGIMPSRWSAGVAAASFLLVLGFAAGRVVHWNGSALPDAAEMSLFNPATSRIRGIQPGEGGRVRIIVDQIHQNVLVGNMGDSAIRQMLLAAIRDPDDPGVRYDSVEVLDHQNGDDIRDALLFAVRHDPNAGIRLKALEGLRQFTGDPAARDGLTYVLEHDSDPGVRSQAIDILAPATDKLPFSPELVNALQDAMRSDQSDDTVRLRCWHLLNEVQTSHNIY